jgi:hypothetical protein
MKPWVIVHFQPIEKYPPVVNCARFIAEQPGYKGNVSMLTTDAGAGNTFLDIKGVTIHRLATWKKRNRWMRLWFYIQFNVRAAWWLWRKKPDKVIYFETLSAFGPWIYKKWFNRRAAVYIHYHEYTSTEEYRAGMALNRWLHNKELTLYPLSAWVSHTNTERMGMFLQDVGKQAPPHTFIIPNYPSAAWGNKAAGVSRNEDNRIGFVYVGALSLNTMYTKEMAQFIAANPDTCYWHIYSDNFDEEVMHFLNSLKATNIFFKGRVQYDELSLVLPKYDVGVILYKGDTLNYAFNAPNKFFEYLACGLHVWYDKGMKGMKGFEQTQKAPYVLCVDFERHAFPEPGLVYQRPVGVQQVYKSEDIYRTLWLHLI